MSPWPPSKPGPDPRPGRARDPAARSRDPAGRRRWPEGRAHLPARALAQPRLVHRRTPERRPADGLVPRFGRAEGGRRADPGRPAAGRRGGVERAVSARGHAGLPGHELHPAARAGQRGWPPSVAVLAHDPGESLGERPDEGQGLDRLRWAGSAGVAVAGRASHEARRGLPRPGGGEDGRVLPEPGLHRRHGPSPPRSRPGSGPRATWSRPPTS